MVYIDGEARDALGTVQGPWLGVVTLELEGGGMPVMSSSALTPDRAISPRSLVRSQECGSTGTPPPCQRENEGRSGAAHPLACAT